MKKVFILTLFCLSSIYSFSQGGPKWQTSGNALTTGDWLGSSNFEPLIMKTDGQVRFRINANGNIIFKEFDGLGTTGLFTYDLNGKLVGIPFTGSPSQVLLGNGTFGSISALTGWTVLPSTVITSSKVGIGVTGPIEALEVNGNIIANGTISVQQVLVGDVVNSQKSLRIASSLCMKGFDATIPGSRSEVCGMGHDFYIQSTTGLNNHTILNYSNTGNVGIGTNNPLFKLDVVGSTNISGNLNVAGETFYTGKTHIFRLSPMPGDSVVRIGDSTILFGPSNRIYPDYLTWTPATSVKGTGFGQPGSIGYGEYALALGSIVKAYGNASVGLGSNLKTLTGSDKAIVIGSGFNLLNPLVNGIPNSLMVGFNSNIPTLLVSPATGLGTTGNVSIGTTCATYKLTVEGEVGCRGVWVKQTPWCDFVYAEDYKLLSYSELKQFFKANKHHPNIKSQQEIEKNEGYSLNDMCKDQMKTIEEQSLYILDLNDRLEQIEKDNAELKALVQQLLTDKK